MKKNEKIWVALMQGFDKYWGCHQMPERSFFICQFQFPICARCTGILIGEILGIILIIFKCIPKIFICIISLFPLIVDGSIQYFKSIESNNTRRFITGLLFGISTIQIIYHFFKNLFKK